MTIAIYPGSFDPITKGHLDIILRASKMFDEVIVAVMVNPKKQASFTQEERAELIRKCIQNTPNIKVMVGQGLTVDFARKLGATVLIRGIRAVVDYEYELQQATANMMLNPEIETIFFVAKPEYSFLSSSISKEIAGYRDDLSDFIPEEIHDEVRKKLSQQKIV